ncbi:hypothetical protein QAD02_017191 [Eretmocerus hayati]|uniref:Uncharacterized protein n=1 Tax=Eretmocerus hayati TaxID=131215 RepID=A0ACC2PDM0_9HYME|nr:hypothetical protein QAD02_017191 [Eretmocerus hayati]
MEKQRSDKGLATDCTSIRSIPRSPKKDEQASDDSTNKISGKPSLAATATAVVAPRTKTDQKSAIYPTGPLGNPTKEIMQSPVSSLPSSKSTQVTPPKDDRLTKNPEKVPVIEQLPYEPVRTAVPRTRPPRPGPANVNARPIVLATHLVPSLPMGLFELLAEAVEAATGQPCVLLHESRSDRPVASHIVDLAILPVGMEWEGGNLLPLSFVFEHRLNKNFSPGVYADVVVATDRAPHVEDIMDLRGHRCALPDRRKALGATTLLFNHLRSKGEGPAFFGNTLDANSQISALQMVAGKQVEVCILESPVIKYHRKSLPGVYSLYILSSLGPLPPYPIMTNKNMPADTANKIKEYLLNVRLDSEWLEKFAPYSVLGFATYNKSLYDIQEMKAVVTSAPYY